MGITVELVGVGEGSGTFAGIWTLGNASCTPVARQEVAFVLEHWVANQRRVILDLPHFTAG